MSHSECSAALAGLYKLVTFPTPIPWGGGSRGLGVLDRVLLGGSLGEDRELLHGEGVPEGFCRGVAPEPVALMAALEVVVGEEAAKVSLELLEALVPGGAAGDAEAVVEQGPVHPADKAIGAERADLAGAVVDVFDGEQ